MSEEHEKQFTSWFAKFITQTQKLDYESICKKAFMAGVETAQQPLALDLPETLAENEHPSACVHRKACIFYKPASQ